MEMDERARRNAQVFKNHAMMDEDELKREFPPEKKTRCTCSSTSTEPCAHCQAEYDV